MLRPTLHRTLRPLLSALPAAALLLSGAAMAQTPAPAPEAAAPGATPPLMTAPRPDDQSTTDPVASPPSISGEAPSREGQQGTAPTGAAAAGSPPAGSPPVAALPPAALNPDQARAMVGTELRTRDGRPGGRILDFTLAEPANPADPANPAGDRLNRIVVAPNDVLGLGEKLVAVPLGALTNGPDGPALDLDQADLAQAPTFAYGSERTLTRPDRQ
ncbi:PRC-barrel domain containing protein [Azospirillum sp. HJ39]|uniref:PRC-barrel domain containing protein n=1 Tax=Azospirillum sp. HJ39 TaxID=3159496 RepID=UPI0035573F39